MRVQDSLGGNTRTCLIATIGPAAENADETLCTLGEKRFAENPSAMKGGEFSKARPSVALPLLPRRLRPPSEEHRDKTRGHSAALASGPRLSTGPRKQATPTAADSPARKGRSVSSAERPRRGAAQVADTRAPGVCSPEADLSSRESPRRRTQCLAGASTGKRPAGASAAGRRVRTPSQAAGEFPFSLPSDETTFLSAASFIGDLHSGAGLLPHCLLRGTCSASKRSALSRRSFSHRGLRMHTRPLGLWPFCEKQWPTCRRSSAGASKRRTKDAQRWKAALRLKLR